MRRRRQPLTAFACICLVALAGCSGSDSIGYDSPEACFNGIRTAIGNGDYKTALNSVTDETQNSFAGLMVMAGAGMKAMGGMAAMMGGDNPEAKKMMEALTAITKVLDNHGATDEKLQEAMGEGGMMGMMMGGGPSEDAINKLAGVVDDKSQFVLDMVDAFMQLGDGQGPDPKEIIDVMSKAELGDVKIDGDKATATVTVTPPDGSPPETEPVEFRKTADGWKLHINMDALQGGDDMEMEMEMREGEFNMDEFNAEGFGQGEGEEGSFSFEFGEEAETEDAEEAVAE